MTVAAPIMPPLLEKYLAEKSKLVDKQLERFMAKRAERPEKIREAMAYSIFAGGKRLRPALVCAAAEACGLPAKKVLKAASALEMIHTYSLIHDDLPAMDDDDMRRGKPTNHKVFGEAFAILAGDGLLTLAFEAAAENALDLGLSGRASSELILAIAKGSGCEGMVGGQVADLEGEGWKTKNHGFQPAKHLDYVHLHKTGSLIVASLEAGAICAEASPARRKALVEYGRAVGLAFQIADDVLDVIGDKKKLGKSGSDAQNDKLTYAALYGVEDSMKKARALSARAKTLLAPFGPKADVLRDLADYVVNRDK